MGQFDSARMRKTYSYFRAKPVFTEVPNEYTTLVKDAVRVATTGSVTLSGVQTIDGVTLSVGNSVLVKDQVNGAQNGIYVVQSGAWYRRGDMDSSAECISGMFIAVLEGTAWAQTIWMLSNEGNISLNSTALTFALISGGGIASGSSTSLAVANKLVIRDAAAGAAFHVVGATQVTSSTDLRMFGSGYTLGSTDGGTLISGSSTSIYMSVSGGDDNFQIVQGSGFSFNAADDAFTVQVGADLDLNTNQNASINAGTSASLLAGAEVVLQGPEVNFNDGFSREVIKWSLDAAGNASARIIKGATFNFSQSAQTTNAACKDLTLTPQAPYVSASGNSRIGGNLVISLPAATNGYAGVPAGLQVKEGSTQYVQLGHYTPGTPYGSQWFGTTTPSQTNFAFLGDGATQVFLNTPAGGNIDLSVGGIAGTGLQIISAQSQIGLAMSNVVWGSGNTPNLSQSARTGTGANIGAPTSIQAQDGQAQTGGAANNNGGKITVNTGKRGTGGSGAQALPGVFEWQMGGTQAMYLQFDPVSTDCRLVLGAAPAYMLFAANGSGQQVFFQALGGATNFEAQAHVFYDAVGPFEALRITPNATTQTAIQLASTTTASYLQASTAITNVSGAALTFQAQAAIGANSVGGNMVLNAGGGGRSDLSGKVIMSGSSVQMTINAVTASLSDGWSKLRSAKVTTSGSTATRIFTLVMPNNSISALSWKGLMKTVGASGDTKVVGDLIRAECITGSVTVFNNLITAITSSDAGLGPATLVASSSGNSVIWTATGLAATVIDWSVFVDGQIFVP